MKTIELEYILQEFETYVTISQPHNTTPIFLKENVLIAMRKACEQTIDLCAENAEIEKQWLDYIGKNPIVRQSILDTKKQIT